MVAVLEEQRQLTREALDLIGSNGFALAGSGAVREHGLIARPTKDIDLFCSPQSEEGFGKAVDKLLEGLEGLGYDILVSRRNNTFLAASLSKDGLNIDLDMGIDYRSYPPAYLSVGPVLDIKDAVANKACAMFSRGEARDYLDLDSILKNGPFAESEILALAAENDPGLTPELFAASLKQVENLQPEQVAPYQITASELQAIKTRLAQWSVRLQTSSSTKSQLGQEKKKRMTIDREGVPKKDQATPANDQRAAAVSSEARRTRATNNPHQNRSL